MKEKKGREENMALAGIKIFSMWRKPIAAHALLLIKANKICNKEQLELIKQKHYSLLLRRACSNLNLSLVRLLIQFKDRIDLKIDETSSNGKTALDWAMTSTVKPDKDREQICEILKKAAANKHKSEKAQLKQ